ncbi:MAG: hypothetical protein B6U95_05675 [Thermofilum sp. ex4484_82]|nr:MAG: hypothetical protein B6U95_05675 [Thermofilum sp. ex4484_82]OYT37868.1 MAG: hypothetical protein B6U96_05670 [Archaeoglobales archaeon ex4484_92]
MGIRGFIAWKFIAKKTRRILFQSLVASTIEYLENLGKKPSEIYKDLKEIGKKMGMWIYSEYLSKAGSASKSIWDHGANFNLGFKFFTGKTFDNIYYNISENGKDVKIHYIIKDNPICKGIKPPAPEIKPSAIVAGVFEWIEENRKEDWNATSVTCDEVKCIASGDEFCEIVFHFKLNEKGAEEVLKKIGGKPQESCIIKVK